ncbi:hypothetical protein L4174_011325 [Photobacterium sp. CCB-ST2H9]|uniref:hypothetical protein n=1 Tax=unclassified Photobacterium TaxID=2628852 RepID=UPI00200660E6|nr:hypothetical protein [Photobacterium sp. CCB-ST2H9]UTM56421.1 hypothetical protein L4174_011325 [Photobacterium sp. CCB-ST2H9]
MTDLELTHIASQVVSNTKFWIALVGVVGAIIGSIVAILGNMSLEWYKNRDQRKIDQARQLTLQTILEQSESGWCDLSALAAVIGCNEEQTKTHLIQIHARGSEHFPGKWGLISRCPLHEISPEAIRQASLKPSV